MLLNREGSQLTPSIVHLSSADGTVGALVGAAAVKHLMQSPTTTANVVKRLVGRTFTDPEVGAGRVVDHAG